MSEVLQIDKQYQDYAYVTKSDLVDVYKKYSKSLNNNVCGAESDSDGEDDDSSSESEDDLLFLI